MDLLDWQGRRTEADRLLELLRAQGLCVQPYDRDRHGTPASVCVLADPAGAYTLQQPYPTIAIFEGEDRAALRAIAKTGIPAITAGLSEHDTVTYSSMAQERCAVTVGRPFLTLRGTSVQEQEIVLPCPCAGTPLLLFVTTALVLGVAPELLPGMFSLS